MPLLTLKELESMSPVFQGSMGNASADEYQSAGHDVRADDATSNAGKEASQQGMLEEGIVQ